MKTLDMKMSRLLTKENTLSPLWKFNMKSSFVKTNIISLRQVEVFLLQEDGYDLNPKIVVLKNVKTVVKHTIEEKKAKNKILRLVLKLEEDFVFGYSYEIISEDGGRIFVDVSSAVDFECFDILFNYTGDDLGPTYSKEHTDFALWAPLASEVMISYFINGERIIKPLIRGDRGVYRIRIEGDLENVAYRYMVTNSGIQRYANDPYAKSVSLNSDSSAVIDLDNVKKTTKKPRYNLKLSKLESIIYELSVRDFTIQRSNDVEAKGKFLGLIEKNRKTLKGEKAGFDYILDLGISHVQLLPVCDFHGVDDLDVRKSYNWGYDNLSFFALEGSYSVNPENPSRRLYEFKQMVDAFHEHNIGVNLDVVYNHVYDFHNSDLEKIVPSYFFRKKEDGRISNGSFCGNDLATERFMARKIIVDSAFYLADVFDIDGFRFDLLGMIDKETIDTLKKKIRKIKPNFMFYGEGWNSDTPLESSKKVTIENAFINKDISFFNDTFRDIVKGSSFDVQKRGYVSGDCSYTDGLIYSFLGSSINTIYEPKFFSIEQSINYVECHDNNTLFDKLVAANGDEDEETILKRVRLANAIVIFSLGVPFIHMGQEIGLTKYGRDNTYNFLDRFNQMDYKVVEKRQEMLKDFISMIELRKMISFYKEKSVLKTVRNFEFATLNQGVFIVKRKKVNVGNLKGDLLFYFNPSNETVFYDLDEYYCLLTAFEGKAFCDRISTKNLTIPPISFGILLKTK